MTPDERREQYAADITYGTNNEFGFDYLRDNMAWTLDELVQRGHHFAIVDEVDSILIDEARTPLIISGPADQPTKWYAEFARSSERLRAATATTRSTRRSAPSASWSPASSGSRTTSASTTSTSRVNTPLVGFLNNAIKAKELFKRDKDYVVMNGEVLIVDEHTGRMLPAAATTRACTRPSRPRRAWRSRTRTRRSPRSPCRTTSACTTSSPA